MRNSAAASLNRKNLRRLNKQAVVNRSFSKTRFALKHFEDADIFGTAAQMAYFLLLSLFPLLLFLVTLIGYLPIDERPFAEFVSTYAPHEITEFIHMNMKQLIDTRNGGLLSLGILGTLWSASNGINALTKAMNRAYGKEEDRSYFAAKLISLSLTIALIALVCVALLLPVFGKMLGIYVFSFIGLPEDFILIWIPLRWVISSFVLLLVLSVLYKLTPNRIIRWKDTLWGAALATLAWQVVSLGFSFYVSKIGHYSATYGSLGAIIILLVWFYLSGIIILAGGTFNAFLADKEKSCSNE